MSPAAPIQLLRAGQISIQVRIAGAGDVVDLVLAFTPGDINQIETAIKDHPTRIAAMGAHKGWRNKGGEHAAPAIG
jgi:hypothetical protein